MGNSRSTSSYIANCASFLKLIYMKFIYLINTSNNIKIIAKRLISFINQGIGMCGSPSSSRNKNVMILRKFIYFTSVNAVSHYLRFKSI